MRILFMVLAMMVAATWIVQAAPAGATPPQDLIGKKVAFVEVVGATQVGPDAVLAVTRLKPGDIWSPDKVRQDLKLIYEMGTFADVTADFTGIPEGVKVVYNVKENPTLKGVVFQGNNKVGKDKLASFLTVKTGSVLNSKTVADNLRAIEGYYKGLGYILAKAGDVNFDPDGILTIRINEGLVEDIVVKGNVKTKSYVITREMNLKKGQPFNSKDARRSMQKLYNLGFFEDVNVKLVPGIQPGATVVEITVVEQKTGTFSIGGGYSASDGLVGIISVGDKNFRGIGDNAEIHWEFGGRTETAGNYSLNYLHPWLDSKQTSLAFSLYNKIYQYTDYNSNGDELSTYNKKFRGFDLSLGRPVNDQISHFITFKNRWDEFSQYISGPVNYDPNGPPTAGYENYTATNFGLTRSISLSRVFDSRDNNTNPTEGTRYSILAEFAGLGGDFNFEKNTFEIRHYWKVGKSQVVATRATMGFAAGDVPYQQKFAVGGSFTLRGYRDDQFKGDRMFAASIEYRFPIAKRVQAALFTDLGNAWGNNVWSNNSWITEANSQSLYYGIGAGIRLVTPFGPIRIDYAVGSQGGRTHFGFGGQF